MSGFDATILPSLRAIPLFRLAPDHEIDASFAARDDAARLVEVWRAACAPTRATLGGAARLFHDGAALLPRRFRRAAWLATLRAVLAAGRAFFDEQLRPASARAIRDRLAFLARRHEHVPDGFTPRFRFPEAFARFVDGDTVEEAVARFHLVAALNEVQQHAYTLHLAERMRLPELRRHAARERAMAIAYFTGAPAVDRARWRECILVLDGLNAATLAMALQERRLALPAALLRESLRVDEEWARFVAGL